LLFFKDSTLAADQQPETETSNLGEAGGTGEERRRMPKSESSAKNVARARAARAAKMGWVKEAKIEIVDDDEKQQQQQQQETTEKDDADTVVSSSQISNDDSQSALVDPHPKAKVLRLRHTLKNPLKRSGDFIFDDEVDAYKKTLQMKMCHKLEGSSRVSR